MLLRASFELHVVLARVSLVETISLLAERQKEVYRESY